MICQPIRRNPQGKGLDLGRLLLELDPENHRASLVYAWASGIQRTALARADQEQAVADFDMVTWKGLEPKEIQPAQAGIHETRTPAQLEALFRQMKKRILERMLGAELKHHLGYAPGEEKPAG